MTTPRLRIISDDQTVVQTAIPTPVNIPPPPIHTIDELTPQPLVMPQPSTPRSAARVIEFSDMSKCYIKTEWAEKYPSLNTDIVFRRYDFFKTYIFPILNGETLKFSDCDTKGELNNLFEELKSYGIPLTNNQLIDVSIQSGLNSLIDQVLLYVHKTENGCISSKKYKERYAAFSRMWDNDYINLKSIMKQDQTIKEYTSSRIMNTLQNKDKLTLFQLNMQSYNIVYDWVSYFFDYVKMKKETFENLLFEMANSVDINMVQTVSDIGSVIINLVNGIAMNPATKNVIIEKITSWIAVKNLVRS